VDEFYTLTDADGRRLMVRLFDITAVQEGVAPGIDGIKLVLICMRDGKTFACRDDDRAHMDAIQDQARGYSAST